MNRHRVLARVAPVLALAAAFAAGRLTLAGDEPPKTVRAKHYRIVYAESGLDLSHGGGRWVDEVFLPDAKVAGMLLFDTDVKTSADGKSVEFEDRVRLFAYPAEKPRNDLTGLGGTPSAIDEIEVPADLAKRIVELADLTARQNAESLRLGKETAERLGWKEIPGAE